MAYELVDKHGTLRKILEQFHKLFENNFVIKMEEKEDKYRKKDVRNELIQVEFGNENIFQSQENNILTSSYHTKNALMNVNKSTIKIIRKQSKIGLFDN